MNVNIKDKSVDIVTIKENKIEFCHTLNGSSLALPRIIAAILENNQINEKIFIPKILHSYCGFSEI